MRKAISIALMILLAGCASSDNKQKQLEMLASNRASLLSSELPIEHGPLSIMRASSSGTTIEIMMIYNDEAPGAISTQRLLNATMSHYCSDDSVRKNLEVGLNYRLKIRNSRGQLMVDQMINNTQC